jgi:serine/threonine-protein kinase
MADPRILADRYEVESVIGHGGMAQVYLGTDRVLGRQVALKILSSQFARDATFVARFRREAQAAASLIHPNVVGVFDTGSDDGTHYIVMEYVPGKTLAQVVREDAPLLPERAVEIAEAVAGGLAFAHRQGIIHRDVKPGNIMLTTNGDVKVMDFGIARATSSESLTQTATVLGTATYFSPEQAQGEKVDTRSDIYSLGCVLYEMLTAHPPFEADSPVAVAYKHVREDPVPPSAINPDVPQAVDAIVMKCLAKNPDNRYQTAEELKEDLRRFRTGEQVMATPILPVTRTEVIERTARPTSVLPTRAVEPVRKSRRWVAWTIMAVLLLLLATGLAFLAANLLSSGGTTTVPTSIIGKPVRVAQAILNQSGFKSRVSPQRIVSPYPKGIVGDYDPKQASIGDTITLFLSRGQPVTSVPVPDVSCEPLAQAESELRAAGFLVTTGGVADNANCTSPDVVARTEPPAGRKVAKGSTIAILTVPKPSPSPTTPSPSPSPSPSTSPSPSPSPSPSTSPSPTVSGATIGPPPGGPPALLQAPGVRPGRQ